MKESNLDIQRALVDGMNTERIGARNQELLAKCKNLRPTKYGLAFNNPINNPIVGATAVWPYPQLFKGQRVTLLCEDQAVWAVNETSWGRAAIQPYKIASAMTGSDVTATIPAGGGAWVFAEFGDVWFLFKENCMLVKAPYYSDFKMMLITTADDDFTCLAGANVSNRLFLGGISADTLLATPDFQAAWSAWLENSSEWSDSMTYEDLTLAPNVVMYSTRAGGDVFWPFSVEMALLGFPAIDSLENRAIYKANYVDWIRKGDIGFVPLPHQGSVLNLKRLGNSVVAYCEDGVSIISPRQERGFHTRVLHQSGIASRLAVSGDDTAHQFVDTHGIRYGITADGSISRESGVGVFSNMIASRATNPIIASYDPVEQEHYFCTDQEGFLATPTGMGEITKLPTSLIASPGGLVGVAEDLGVPDIEIETETFDMGIKALKTIHSVSVGFQDIANLKVKVLYRYDNSTTFRESSAFAINNDGVAVAIVTAHDFRLVFTGTPGPDAKIDYVTVRFQTGDKRNIRGLYGQG